MYISEVPACQLRARKRTEEKGAKVRYGRSGRKGNAAQEARARWEERWGARGRREGESSPAVHL